MKAQWEDAPEWAQWWARDPDGFEWRHENEPIWNTYFEIWDSGLWSKFKEAYWPPSEVNVPRVKGCRP